MHSYYTLQATTRLTEQPWHGLVKASQEALQDYHRLNFKGDHQLSDLSPVSSFYVLLALTELK